MRKLLAILASIATFLACHAPAHKTKIEAEIANAKTAVVRLEVPGRTCTAFHVGNDIFITAAHCLDEQNLIFLHAEDESGYLAVPLVVDLKTDLATLKTKMPFRGGTLPIWSGPQPNIGSQLIAFGYPGYYNIRFIFEVSLLKDFVASNDARMILSTDLGYPGESGGPVLDVESGQVIGVNDQIGEFVQVMGESADIPIHYHKTLTLIVGYPEIISIIERSKPLIDQKGGL